MASLNSNRGITEGSEPGLLGIEIGRNKVRLVLLDREGNELRDVVERPIVKAGGPRDPIEEEFSTRSAIEAGLNRFELDQSGMLLVGATMGFPNCGVGSGPAIRDWLATLSDDIGEPLVYSGDTGLSYAPTSCVDFVRRVFEPLDLHLDRVELAPVAASRCLDLLPSGAMTLGSGVAWSARILNNQVLEAFETIDGLFDEVLQFSSNGRHSELDRLQGVNTDPMILSGRGVKIGSLGPSVGVAVGLLDFDASNLLDGTRVTGVQYAGPAQAEPQAASSRDVPVERLPLSEPLRPDPDPAPVPPPDPTAADPWGQSAARSSAPDPFGGGVPPGELGRFDDAAAGPHDMGDTHDLRRPSERLERSRDSAENQPASGGGQPRDPRLGRGPRDDMAGIEAFAHPAETSKSGSFHISDFVLGALGMLAIMLIIALVLWR